MKHHTILILSFLLAIQPLLAQEVATDFAATDFSVRSLEGERFKLEDLEGQLVMLNFWFVQCQPCVQEMPELNELVSEHQSEGVVFLAFALNSKPELQRFLEKKDFNYEIVPNAQAVAEDYGVEGYPTHILIDQAGDIVYRTMGYSSTTVGDLNQALTERLSISQQ